MSVFSHPRLLRRKEVEKITGLSRATLYRQIGRGAFPKPVRTSTRSVAWRVEDVEDWLDELEY